MNRFIRSVLILATCSSLPAFALPADFHEVTKTLSRGARPTREDLRQLERRGVETIVDLENDEAVVREEEKIASSLGMKFINIPMSAGHRPNDRDVDRAIREIGAKHSGKIFVHCQRGKDRTGLVVALYRVETQGWRSRRAYQEMMDLGFSLKYAKPLEVYYRDRTGMHGLDREAR